MVLDSEGNLCGATQTGSRKLKNDLGRFPRISRRDRTVCGTHARRLADLWWDAKGDWKRAHESAQQDEGKDSSWVHAYLHRKEGDQSNAAYWYNRAAKPVCREPLDAEWVSIVKALLG